MYQPQPDNVEIVTADLTRVDHQKSVLMLIDAYARDPMGNGQALSEAVKKELVAGLQKHPTTLILLAFSGGRAVGIAVCFVGFSTFAAKPLINIHDLAVLPDQRGAGVGKRLLAAVEDHARQVGCCKVTLEVLANNHRALKVYGAAGFVPATYTEAAGEALFYTKALA